MYFSQGFLCTLSFKLTIPFLDHHMYWAPTFFHSFRCLCSDNCCLFCAETFLFNVNFLINVNFCLLPWIWNPYPENHCLWLVFSCSGFRFRFSCFFFRSLIHFKLIFIQEETWIKFQCFTHAYLFSREDCWKGYLI